MSISVHLLKNLLSFGDYFQYSCVISMNENFRGNFLGIKLAGATPNMVTFRGFFWKFRRASLPVIYGSPHPQPGNESPSNALDVKYLRIFNITFLMFGCWRQWQEPNLTRPAVLSGRGRTRAHPWTVAGFRACRTMSVIKWVSRLKCIVVKPFVNLVPSLSGKQNGYFRSTSPLGNCDEWCDYRFWRSRLLCTKSSAAYTYRFCCNIYCLQRNPGFNDMPRER